VKHEVAFATGHDQQPGRFMYRVGTRNQSVALLRRGNMKEEKIIIGTGEMDFKCSTTTTPSPSSLPNFIHPEPGRHVHFYVREFAKLDFDAEVEVGKPHAAIIASFDTPHSVNLSVLGADGKWFPMKYVHLLQPGETAPDHKPVWCQWMPYTQAKAAQG
jgi:hypothetical protein